MIAPAPLAEIPLHLGPEESGDEEMSPQLLEDPVSFFIAGYRAHGPVFRVRYRGRDWVVIAGQDANDFFWQNPLNWSFAEARPGFRTELGHTHVTQLDGPAHARKRRLLKAGFSTEAAARHVSTLARETGSWLSVEENCPGQLMDLLVNLLLTLNSRTLLKVDLTAEDRRQMIAFEEDLMFGINASCRPQEFFSEDPYRSAKAYVFARLDGIIQARLAGERRDDNLQAIIDQDPGDFEPMTPEELRADCYLLLIAGIENTGRLIARCLEHLSQDPAWLAEVRAELAGYGPDSFSRGLSAFPKLRATIFETERLHPGVVFMSRLPIRDLELAGRPIPAHVPVLQVHTLPHFLPENYPDPEVFRPQRWLDATPGRKTHLLFGGGAHVCLGMNVARLHMPIVLAEFIRRFDWELGYVPSYRLTVDPGVARHRKLTPITLRPAGVAA
jgi:cytochrome P450